MRYSFSEQLDALQQAAITEAEQVLCAKGFQRNDDNRWHGTLDLGAYGTIAASVRLPSHFPDTLPDVFVDVAILERGIPHVEQSGRVCIAPSTGTLIDATRPQALIEEALARAIRTVVEGLSGENDNDFGDEFEAYWVDQQTQRVWSTCNPDGSARPVTCVQLQTSKVGPPLHRLFADSSDAAKTWARRTGWYVGQRQPAFFLPLDTAFRPASAPLTFSNISDLIQQHAAEEAYNSTLAWLRSVTLPATILLAVPLRPPQGVAVVGVDLQLAHGHILRLAQRGFRKGRIPAFHALSFQRVQPVTRLLVERLDPTYLLRRGGATTTLFDRTVVVIGCGAVGSHVVNHLASLGAGRLRLIDPDQLSSANVHRHVLGMTYLGFNKAHGMVVEISRRFPHLTVEHRTTTIEVVLREEPDFVTTSDLVIIAVGDATIERRLNELFGPRKPRLHVWVEPLGLGGHVLATGIANQRGCYECLYEHNAIHGLVNSASFAAPGRSFHRTMGGCSGQFVPFPVLDADRIANEAARLATRILQSEEREHVLLSVREDEQAFCADGFALGPRARVVPVGERRRELRYVRGDCPTCSRWSA